MRGDERESSSGGGVEGEGAVISGPLKGFEH